MKERRCKTAQCLRDARGFTLVELILTIAILAIVTIPILSYFTDAAKHNARSRQKQNATVLAQEVLENFKHSAYNLDDPNVVCSADPNWTVAAPQSSDGSYSLTQNKDVDRNSFKVTAKITPLNKVNDAAVSAAPASSVAPASVSKDYEKFVIGTMDTSKDLMSSDHGQTLVAASFAFNNKYTAACAANGVTPEPAGTPDPVTGVTPAKIDANYFKNRLNCEIIVSAKKDTSKPGYDVISVKYRYTYNKGGEAYPEGIDTNTVYEDVVASSSIKVDKLENIYLFYNPLNVNDKITMTTDDDYQLQNNAGDLNMFIIAQNSVPASTSDSDLPTGYSKRPGSYKLPINGAGSGFENKIKCVYTNLSRTAAMTELDETSTIGGKVQTGPDGNYTLVHSEKINRVADITVTVDSQDGKTQKIVEVTGSKTQD